MSPLGALAGAAAAAAAAAAAEMVVLFLDLGPVLGP